MQVQGVNLHKQERSRFQILSFLMKCIIIIIFFNSQPDDPEYASQKRVYDDLGQEMLAHAFEGYLLFVPFSFDNNLKCPK